MRKDWRVELNTVGWCISRSHRMIITCPDVQTPVAHTDSSSLSRDRTERSSRLHLPALGCERKHQEFMRMWWKHVMVSFKNEERNEYNLIPSLCFLWAGDTDEGELLWTGEVFDSKSCWIRCQAKSLINFSSNEPSSTSAIQKGFWMITKCCHLLQLGLFLFYFLSE